jgi:hypothetical protein
MEQSKDSRRSAQANLGGEKARPCTEPARAALPNLCASVFDAAPDAGLRFDACEVGGGISIRTARVTNAVVVGEFLPLVLIHRNKVPIFLRESSVYRDDFDQRAAKYFTAGVPPTYFKLPRLSGRTLFLAGPGAENYFHWVNDYLPRLIAAEKSGGDFFVLVPSTRGKRYITESLAMLEVSRSRIREYDGQPVHCEELILTEDLDRHPCSMAHAPLLNEVRGRLLKATSRTDAPFRRSAKIYLAREGPGVNRTLERESTLALESWFGARGFVKIRAESLSFHDQVRQLHSAALVVGCHGAGLVNTLFMHGGSVIEFFPERGVSSCWYFVKECQEKLGHSLNWKAINCAIVPELLQGAPGEQERFKIRAQVAELEEAFQEVQR